MYGNELVLCQQIVDGQQEEVPLVKPHLLLEGGGGVPIHTAMHGEAIDDWNSHTCQLFYLAYFTHQFTEGTLLPLLHLTKHFLAQLNDLIRTIT